MIETSLVNYHGETIEKNGSRILTKRISFKFNDSQIRDEMKARLKRLDTNLFYGMEVSLSSLSLL